MNTRTFALVLGLVFIAIGAAGFVPALAYPETGIQAGDNMIAANAMAAMHGDQSDNMLFGWFPVNFGHNLIHILFGLWGLIASRSASGARTYARGVAIICALLAVAGLIPATYEGFGLVPLYAKSVWLHGLIALVAAYFGWVNREATA